jgi:hypothetical protein
MNIDLRCDDAGQDFAAVGNNGGSRLIARRLNAENANAHSAS